MNPYLKVAAWQIVEEGFDAKNQESSESIFSLGNGYMGQRANFEESYSGASLQGSYIAGVYYTDKTRVGWWKNGYPDYFAKVLNAPYWNGIRIHIDGEELNLAACRVESFRRVLDMKHGVLERSFKAILPSGKKIEVQCKRFLSMAQKELAVMEYALKALNFSGEVNFTSYLDGNVKNHDANYDEAFWNILQTDAESSSCYLLAETKKTGFVVGMGSTYDMTIDGKAASLIHEKALALKKMAMNQAYCQLNEGQQVVFHKYVSVVHSMNVAKEYQLAKAKELVTDALAQGFVKLCEAHQEYWAKIWEHADIVIEGDEAAQQAIRFNIFQLNQTYTGEDSRLNIGPKGFTGEKYGGSTYWDTEAYCLPFYLSTAPARIARNLLIYRYNQLDKAIENAAKLGFTGGAALFPMVTMNGEECHNEWEITFEEIHRNGAIAYAIANYINYTGDESYLLQGGLEVLVGICRFWSQRVNWSEARQQYVMLGVTGPNEYENNVNNNWYTSKLAQWCLDYTLQMLHKVEQQWPEEYLTIVQKLEFDCEKEESDWRERIDHLYLGEDAKRGIFVQQDGYFDKEQRLAADLDLSERPINQHWSWDRILRSCFIKQADVLQGVYFFEDEYDTPTIERNYNFYEPRTVHESSLSPCVHSILASRIGYLSDAYRLYLRTARLDLDDYNCEVAEGLHITSMAGTWLSVVQGFGGMRVRQGRLCLNPSIPEKWSSYSFNIMFREHVLNVCVTSKSVTVAHREGAALELMMGNESVRLAPNETKTIVYTFNCNI